MVIFSTERTVIRQLIPADLPAYAEMHGDAEVLRYTGSPSWNEEESERDLMRMIDLYNKPAREFVVWAIIESDSGHMIGTCALVGPSIGPEIGYRFIRRYWGQGFGFEVVSGLLDYLKRDTPAREALAFVMTENRGSLRIMEKCGFRLIREFYNDEISAMDREYRFTVNR